MKMSSEWPKRSQTGYYCLLLTFKLKVAINWLLVDKISLSIQTIKVDGSNLSNKSNRVGVVYINLTQTVRLI